MNEYYYILKPHPSFDGRWEWYLWLKGTKQYVDMLITFGVGDCKADANDRAKDHLKRAKLADLNYEEVERMTEIYNA